MLQMDTIQVKVGGRSHLHITTQCFGREREIEGGDSGVVQFTKNDLN